MRLYQIDAFTGQAFRGNPAAVCLLERERDEAWMQASKRGGIVRVRLAGDRVKLGGQAVTVFRGELV